MRLIRSLSVSAVFSIGLMCGPLSAPAVAGAHLDATDDIYWLLTLDLAEGQDACLTSAPTGLI